MKIAIISDTHDNLPNFKKAVDWIKKEAIKILIHCGDVSTLETLGESLNNYSDKVYIVFGNMDFGRQKIQECGKENLPRIRYFEDFGKVKIGKKKIGFCHFPETARRMAKSKKYDIVFYGHTHKPWKEKIGKVKMVNPGNIAGLFYKATFAVYDTKTNKLELKLLEQL